MLVLLLVSGRHAKQQQLSNVALFVVRIQCIMPTHLHASSLRIQNPLCQCK
jgi:hypothetical protein